MSVMKIPRSARYRKRVGAFGATDVKRDESVIGFSTAAECYNFDGTSGALREGYGTAEHEFVPADATRYYMYRYYSEERGEYLDQYVYQCANGLLKYYDPIKQMCLYISGTKYPPMQALNYRLDSKDVLLVSCAGRKLCIWNGTTLKECQSPTITSMALHYERLFVTSADQPTKVFFSDDLDPTDFDIGADGGGFIELLDERGELNKVVSFGNYLYIFRDHGISRVTAYGDQREFSVTHLFVTAGRIFPSSIATCGSYIMFLASDGLYKFDGYECTRALENLDGLIAPRDGCSCAYFDGKYYLACAMNFRDGKNIGCENGEHSVNGLLTVDGATGEYSVTRGTDITFMNACTYNGADMLVCCDGGRGGVITRCGKRFEIPLEKRWRGACGDFGAPDVTKSVRELYIKSDVDCTVVLDCEKKQKRIAVKRGDRRVRVNFNAKRFSLALETSAAECDIKPPTVVYSGY